MANCGRAALALCLGFDFSGVRDCLMISEVFSVARSAEGHSFVRTSGTCWTGAPADMLGSVRCDEITHFGIDGLTKKVSDPPAVNRLVAGSNLARGATANQILSPIRSLQFHSVWHAIGTQSSLAAFRPYPLAELEIVAGLKPRHLRGSRTPMPSKDVWRRSCTFGTGQVASRALVQLRTGYDRLLQTLAGILNIHRTSQPLLASQ